MLKSLLEAFLKITIILGLLLFFLYNFSDEIQASSINPSIRSYYYDSIITTVIINQDSTFDVEETLTFDYTGNYHQGYRSIPFLKIDNITDISVIDGKTNQQLVYSPTRLEKEDPNSWGKFTYYKQDERFIYNKQDGSQNIEWYYDLSDTIYTWKVKYKIHGGLEFKNDWDRFYWNIFSGFDVSVREAQAIIVLPGGFRVDGLPIYSYRTVNKPVDQDISEMDRAVLFKSVDFSPNEAFTVDVSWPKGVVSRTAYWLDFVKIYWGYIFSIVIIVSCLILGFILWLVRERFKQGQETIIPQYNPPENLKPVIAEVIVKERVTSLGLTATIVDLAVRGFLKIEEKPKNKFWSKFVSFIGWVLDFGLLYIMFWLISYVRKFSDALLISIFIVCGVLVRISFKKMGWDAWKLKADYKVTKIKPLEGEDIEEYEKRYLNILFQGKDYFKTESLRNNISDGLGVSIQKLVDNIYKKVGIETKAYEVNLIQKRKKGKIWMWLYVGALCVCSIYVFSQLELGRPFVLEAGQYFIFISVSLVSVIGLYAYIKYEARLNKSGRVLRSEWLGFKLYLEKAEKYRLQNMTPDLFEKYLPYAIVFGIEKKWGKAFEGINMPAPSWYVYGGYYGGGSFGSSGPAFSPSSFSASFVSSFSNSFGGSGGGGGGVGGGGVAGGGGGGGGGGAS